MFIHEDIVLELARLEREALERVRRRMAEGQLGEAWIDLVDERRPLEGDGRRAA